jgi:hypothetical protein
MRSARAKLGSLGADMRARGVQLCFLTEVWEKEGCGVFRGKVRGVLGPTGIHYIGNPRVGRRRGGGVGIVHSGQLCVRKLPVAVEPPLEAVWALLQGPASAIILVSFYSPPHFKQQQNQALVRHLATNLARLRRAHPGAGTIMVADLTRLRVERSLAGDASLRSINRKATRGDRCLDVVITDLWRFFRVPKIIPPVPVDKGEKAVPSDHKGTFTKPKTTATTNSPGRNKQG